MPSERKIIDLIESIYHTVEEPEHWRQVLKELCELLPGAKAAITYRKKADFTVFNAADLKPFMFSANLETQFIDEYMRYYKNEDFLVMLNNHTNNHCQLDLPSSQFTLVSQLLTKKDIISTPYYNDFARTFSIEDCFFLKLFESADYFAVLVFLIDNKKHAVDSATLVFNRLSQHLQRAAKWGILRNTDFFSIFREEALIAVLHEKYQLTTEEARVAIAYSQSGDRQKISDDLSKSLNTIKTHQKNIYKKLGLSHAYRKRNSLVELIQGLDNLNFDPYLKS